MSRLFEALRSVRPDLVEKFEPLGAPSQPLRRAPPPVLPIRTADADEQYLRLAEKLGLAGSDRGRLVGFAGVRGREGTTTVAHGFADFGAKRFHQPAIVLSAAVAAEPQGSGAAQTRIEDLAEPADDRPRRHYASARLLVPERMSAAEAAQLERLLEQLLVEYRLVIVDCPALLRAANLPQLWVAVDAMIVVAEAGLTDEAELAQASRITAAAGAQLRGVVLNKRRNAIPRFLRPLLARLGLI